MIRQLWGAMAAASLLASTAMAQMPTLGSGNQPVEITAQTAIEWDRTAKTIVARGGVTATQGTATLTAQTVTAYYRDEGSMQIDRILADGAVSLTDQGRVVTGDRATYDVSSGKVQVFGNPARLDSPDGSITATQELSYDVRQAIASAQGDAVAVNGDRTIQAPTLLAYFVTQQGRQIIDRIEAQGGVIITTPAETARADSGSYQAAAGIATLRGQVRIAQGRNLLTGEAADINLKTGIAKITTPGSNGRVRVLFYQNEKPTAPGGG